MVYLIYGGDRAKGERGREKGEPGTGMVIEVRIGDEGVEVLE